jgi:hypothetical protein
VYNDDVSTNVGARIRSDKVDRDLAGAADDVARSG